MVENKEVNFLDKLIKDDMFYLYICSMVSADTLIDAETCEDMLKRVQRLKDSLVNSELKTDKIIEYVNDAEKIIIKDLEMYKNK
jgi:hypothetical protein